MEIKTGRRIEIECQNSDNEWKKKWVEYDSYLSLLNAIKSTFSDFSCECKDEVICAMCAVKKIVEKEIKELNTSCAK